MLNIRSMTDGFRRCGMAFTREGQRFADDQFTPEELEQLKSEPMLEVRQVASDVDEVAQARSVLEAMTNDKLKADCDDIGIEYPANATKAQLVELILKHTAPAPEA